MLQRCWRKIPSKERQKKMLNTLKAENDVTIAKRRDTTLPKLLIIDDDESIRKVMGFRLRDSYSIIDSGSPEEALALALKEKPDAILLDLMMPKYSGFEVCQTVSSLSFTQHIPIVIVSGESSAQYKDFCEALGAKDFVQKPVDFDLLQKKLTKLIESKGKANRDEPRVRLRVMLKLRSVSAE